MKRQSNRAHLKLEQLEGRDMPSAVLPITQKGREFAPPLQPAAQTAISATHEPAIELTSFQWGVDRATTEAESVHHPILGIRLPRHVNSATAEAAPTEEITINF
jgi:hypothetical protein